MTVLKNIIGTVASLSFTSGETDKAQPSSFSESDFVATHFDYECDVIKGLIKFREQKDKGDNSPAIDLSKTELCQS